MIAPFSCIASWRRVGRCLQPGQLTSLLAVVLAAALLVGPAEAREGPKSVAPLAERLTDAVVNISTSQKAKGPSGVPLPNVPKGSPFEEFFDDFFNKKDAPKNDRKVSSLGSGRTR